MNTNNRRNIVIALGILATALGGLVIIKSLPPAKKPAPAATTLAVVAKASPTPPAPLSATPAKATALPASPTSPPTTAAPATETGLPPDTATVAPLPSSTPGATVTPWPDAPLCPDHGLEHDNSIFHTIWDADRGCHYDHEHGQSPFTPEISAAFPDIDLKALLGGVEIGHTNPSSPAENVAKHGGFKWQASANAPHGCEVGFEGGTVAIDAYAIQFHAFGPQSIELEARNHSAAALLRQCKDGQQGFIFTVQLQEYGERCLPYQGITLAYPDNFQPEWDCSFGQYFTTEGFGGNGETNCRPSLAFYDNDPFHNNLSVWTSKRTGAVSQPRPAGSTLFNLLFRSRDAYQSLDCADLEYPFTWKWLCSLDGGANFALVPGCRYNNSSVTVHEVAGTIPTAWDNLAGFDTDTRVDRITGQAFVTRFGALVMNCSTPSMDCAPVWLREAFTGKYSTDFCAVKCSNPTPLDTPERDVYFCGEQVCGETDAGARASGWIGSQN